jgi:uncharacterized protein YcsI (UPF0317 family)
MEFQETPEEEEDDCETFWTCGIGARAAVLE